MDLSMGKIYKQIKNVSIPVPQIEIVIKNNMVQVGSHNRHGQFAFHFLVHFWENKEIDTFLMSEALGTNFWGTIDQISGAINETDSAPYVTVLEFLLYNSFLSLSWYGNGDLTWKTSFTICGDRPFTNLNISIVNVWFFLWWVLKEPSFSNTVVHQIQTYTFLHSPIHHA